ncbi:MAG: alpha-1,4-glucan--maltose-1-phosphate maltosyltransferase [Spirochaetales bacterium]|nr:alpha-1,4-glucan--maltose-1-phosphate maltosyltransferase [Spirochaetales bacterium]
MIPKKIDTVVIENVTPEINGGKYAVKRIIGSLFRVEADIFSHGHAVVRASLLFKKEREKNWMETGMEHMENDRWFGCFEVTENCLYEYTILAWRDPYFSWLHDTMKKYDAKQDIAGDLLEGKLIIEKAMSTARKDDKTPFRKALNYIDSYLKPVNTSEAIMGLVNGIKSSLSSNKPIEEDLNKIVEVLENVSFERKIYYSHSDPLKEILEGEELRLMMDKYPDRSDYGQYGKTLRLVADRSEAEYSAWYEMWPRSQGKKPNRSATFDDMIKRLPDIKKMGFNIIYLPPIHPIGRTNRKGPNNSLVCPPGSPGCPYAIGNENGGHKAIDPDLGTMDDFIRFEKACRESGMEIALDLAIQTSPDHPWVKEHPEWFNKRPDGSIKYAENPPKKYEDIYPLNFGIKDYVPLWNAIADIIRFWVGKGVRIFRVDNPHTKPVRFWEWLVDEIHSRYPDVIFLSEAFTRPKMMKELAKAGFTQSYTYFTWRNFKHELEEYFTELTQTETAEYMIGNLFTNTPDILPTVLQNAPRAAFKIRATLASTLSSVWGIYNGFELCEGTPIPGKEEYLDSEKYQFKVWDWDRAGNIKPYIARLNQIREQQPALRTYRNLKFYRAENDKIIFYGKHTKDFTNIILIAVNLDPYQKQEALIQIPLQEFKIKPEENYQVHDLISGHRYYWKGEKNFISLDPNIESAHIFQLLRWSHKEQNYDYYY